MLDPAISVQGSRCGLRSVSCGLNMGRTQAASNQGPRIGHGSVCLGLEPGQDPPSLVQC